MTDEIERLLDGARIATTPNLDERVLAAARRAARPPALRRLFPAAAAAAVLAVLTLGFAMRPVGPARPVQDFDVEIAQAAPIGDQVALIVRRSLPTNGQVTTSSVTIRFSESIDPGVVLALNGFRSDFDILGEAADDEDAPSAEAYDHVVPNPFLDPSRDPLSTFSIDVDTASYTNVRRFLAEGRLPPPGAVRVEEMVNYFSYSYPGPEGDAPFAVLTEVAECPWAPTHALVRIGLQARRVAEADVPPRNLVFLLDVSGSMDQPDKLPLVKAAMKLLAERLREEDNVSIVVYAGASGVVLEPTSGHRKGEVLDAIGRLSAGGSTNGGEGIRLAYDLAAKHFDPAGINRVILATDGDFNVGTTSRDELVSLIEEKRKTGVFLTVLGVGTGNLKDSQMEALADHGNGSYHYLDSLDEARRVLVTEAGGTLVTVAKDVKIQVEWNPARVAAYRLVGYENRLLAAEDFANDAKDAGEIGAGHSVTALYEVVPSGEASPAGDVEPLRYQLPRYPAGSAHPDEMLTVKIRHKAPDGDRSVRSEFPVADPGNVNWTAASEDFRFAAAVAAFAQALREPAFAAGAGCDLSLSLARGALGDDPDGRRAEFLSLVEKAKELPR